MWRQAIRASVRNAAYSITAALVTAVTTAAAATAWTMLYGTVIGPAWNDRREPAVLIEPRRRGSANDDAETVGSSARELGEWRERTRVFSSVSIAARRYFTADWGDGNRLIDGQTIGDDFFRVLRVPMAAGRAPEVGEGEVAIGSDLWRDAFGGSPNVVGRTIRIDDETRTVSGVAPPGFRFTGGSHSLWVPVPRDGQREARTERQYTMVARVAAGQSFERAQAEAQRVADSLAADYPDANGGITVRLTRLTEGRDEPLRAPLWAIAAAVGLIIGTAGLSLASLTSLRDGGRAVEDTTRWALGRTRGRRTGEALTEAALPATVGAAVGLLLWAWTTPFLAGLVPGGTTVTADTLPAAAAAVAAAAVAIWTAGTGLGALTASALRGRGTGAPDQRTGGQKQALTRGGAMVQAAIAVVLADAALRVNSELERLRELDLGFANERVTGTFIDLRARLDGSEGAQTRLVERIVEEVAGIPGIEQASASFGMPPDKLLGGFGFERVDPRTGQEEQHVLSLVAAGPEYFEILGIPLIEGRVFDERDRADTEPVTILSERAARRFFPEGNAAGRMLDGSYRRVAGVVGNVRYRDPNEPAGDTLYFALSQFATPGVYILADGPGDDLADAREIAAAVAAVDPGIAVGETAVSGELPLELTAVPTLLTRAGQALALMALLSTAVSLYGGAAHRTRQRRREYAVRAALGADRARIAGSAFRESLWDTAAGVSVGALAAHLIGAWVGEMAGRNATETIETIAAAGVAVAAASLLAAAVPAWRAGAVDPSEAMKTG